MSYAMMGLGQAAGADLDAWRRDLGLAREAGIPVLVLKALQATESGGNPAAIRFEPHKFWQEVKRMPDATGVQIRESLTPAEMAAVPYTPCTLSWRTAHGLAPCRHTGWSAPSEVGSETNRAAFNRAYAIDPAAAVRATSWGSGQVMGWALLAAFDENPARAVAGFYANPVDTGERMIAAWWRRARRDAKDAANASPPNFNMIAARYNGCSDCTLYAGRLRTHYNRILPEWESVRAAVEAAGALATSAVSTATRNPMTTVLVGVTVLGAGAAFAWWAYSKSKVKRNRRRRR